jgi:hypothetical protein
MQELSENTPFLLLLAMFLVRDMIIPLIRKTGSTIEQDIKSIEEDVKDIKEGIGEMGLSIAVLQTQAKERKKK